MSSSDGSTVVADLLSILSETDGSYGTDGKTNTHAILDSVALPVAAMKVLLNVIKRSASTTMMGLQAELGAASKAMLEHCEHHEICGFKSHIPLSSGCELFMRYVTRSFLDFPDFDKCIEEVKHRGEAFAGLSMAARNKIATNGQQFIRDGMVVLTHGYSRVVYSLLIEAAKDKHFEIVVLEGRPDGGGAKAAQLYAAAGIPVRVVLDLAMGTVLETCDLVIVGAEGVVENGGVVNKVGTFPLAICADALSVPFYVAAESYKFARLFPLNQADLPQVTHQTEPKMYDGTPTSTPLEIKMSPGMVRNIPVDFTPSKYITLLFTDLGVLTPSAVSDELIRLYQ
jgi:translation initiation factor eIF-2B subunit alpha